MKALVQRVSEASVTVDGAEVARIGPGLVVLLGVRQGDDPAYAAWMARKLPALRILDDRNGQMNLSLLDTGGSLLLISQFTLYADARQGNRPSFIAAARPEAAIPLYEDLLGRLRSTLGPARVGAGVFGARMQVSLVNDGPVTLELCSDATPARYGAS
jgi:D-tyrosyl-tRNA(Tyr) deacylase